MRLTLPSASDDTVTWSSAASVPTTSIVRRTVSSRTGSTCTASTESLLPVPFAAVPLLHGRQQRQ